MSDAQTLLAVLARLPPLARHGYNFVMSPAIRTIHDWSVPVGEWEFGIQEYSCKIPHQPVTTGTLIAIGPLRYTTTAPASAIASGAGLFLAFALVVSLVIVKTRRKADTG